MPQPKTDFASAKRLDNGEVYLQTIKVLGLRNTLAVLNVMSCLIAILNEDRQVVYANNAFLAMIGAKDFEDALGQRPGELIKCIHSNENEGGCGTSRDCRYCGAVLTVLESQKTDEIQKDECRITIDMDGKQVSLDLEVLISPITIENERFFVTVLTDISNQKRREYLERTFIHDLANTTGTLTSRIEFFPKDGLDEIQEDYFIKIKHETYKLLEEIQAQRDIVRLENQELKPIMTKVDSLDIIHSVIQTITTDSSAKDKRIVLAKDCDQVTVKTDERLLRRVLLNLLKNALEASKVANEVVIGCKGNNKEITFWVKNEQVLPEEVKSQIFQRSFSTKGIGRGLGTYSARIITEEYLNGKISFESSKKTGTIFSVLIKS
ncbi:MAG: ATP-binding protein [Candidatus Heimdallarchaeota archaeon]